MKKGFTLVELMVVVGMIAILMGAMTVSTSRAQQRGRIAKATQETKEITNAILAYEQYADGHSLAKEAKGSWAKCTEANMAMILGGKTGANGEEIPVLFNANVTGGHLLDPWGRPYEYMIQRFEQGPQPNQPQFYRGVALPNYFRLTDKERSE